ncbi:MAG: J domain-containing protein [Rhodospirillales bacterium]|nr:J domain-containing protein [Rhodospirillales bacterium]
MGETQNKQSYTVTCSSRFRDAVLKMAENRGVNAADLARSVALMVPLEAINAFPDPGEPDLADRETVILKSGKSKGRPWQRKPRLQIRMAAGSTVVFLRKVLAVALELDAGAAHLHLEAPRHGIAPEAIHEKSRRQQAEQETEKLKTIVSALAFAPLAGGIQRVDEAIYVLGFPPGRVPDRAALRTRFRMLASILHPDSGYGSHAHMSQLNTAMDLLRDH